MTDLMDKHDIRCTISLNFSVIDHYPEIFEAMEARNYDYLCHGIYNTRYLWSLPEDEERAVIKDCVDRLRKAVRETGQRRERRPGQRLAAGRSARSHVRASMALLGA